MAQHNSFFRTIKSPLWLFLGATAAFLIVFFSYGIILQNSITEEVQTYLSEIANQTKIQLKKQLQGRMTMVRAIGAMLGPTFLEQPERLVENLRRQRGISEFKRLGIIYKDGRQYTTDNIPMQLMDRVFIHQGFSGEYGISDVMKDPASDDTMHIYYVPVWNGDTVEAVLFAVSSNDSLVEMLQNDFFNSSGYTHLLHKNGDIIRSSAPLETFQYPNIFDLFDIMPQGLTIAPADLLESMRQGKSGRFSYYNKDQHRYVYFTPLEMNNWYLLSSIPTAEIDRMTMQRLLWTSMLVLTILGVLGVVSWQLFNREKGYKRTILSQMEELRTITANIPGGVQRCRHDEWLTMDYVSDGFVEMVGYPREELQQVFANKFLPMIHGDDLFPALRRIDAQLAKGNNIDLEFRIIHADGTAFWAHQKGILVREGDEEFFYCVLLDETEVRTAMDIMQMDAARYGVLFKLSDSILFEFDMRSGQVSTSPKFEETFGYVMPENNFPQSVLDLGLLHAEDLEPFTNLFDCLYSGHREAEADVRICKSTGEFIWCRVQVMGILDQNQICTKAIGKITDIDSQMQELVKLKEEVQRDPFTQLYNKVATETLVRKAISSGHNGALFMIDVDNFKRINDGLGHAFGDTVLLTLATRLQNLFRRSDVVGRIGGDEFAVFLPDLSDDDNLLDKADSICRIFRMPVGEDGTGHHVSGSVGVAVFPQDAQDYASLYANADKALYESKYKGKNCYTFFSHSTISQPTPTAGAIATQDVDSLTGVADETAYAKAGMRLLADAQFARTTIAVMAVKVEGLHHVNSVHGYSQGDAVLRTVSAGLVRCLPREALPARCRGNDFAIAVPLPEGDNTGWFQEFTAELSKYLENNMADSALAWVRVKLGISVFPDQANEFELLNRQARQAVALCPEEHLVSFSRYDEELTRTVRDREELKRDLMLAVHRNELTLQFQPKVHPETKAIISAEALVRWNHPRRGRLSPSEFIPLAEETMVIPLIDNWVIDAACRQWRTLIDGGYPVVPLSINLSHQKFYQANLTQVICDALVAYNIPPTMLTIELTESCALADLTKASEIMRGLREQGLQTAIDDFGAGFFTLSHLRDLPLDEVKLDRSLVADDSTTATESLRSLVNLVKIYKARVVFEGVETDEQYSRAGESGCDLIQGFFTGRPMTGEELGLLLRQQGTALHDPKV